MSKKLLEEGSVRSFMKLANLEPLAEQFVQENYMEGEEEGEEPEMEEPEMDAEPEMDDDDEMEMEPEMDAAPAGGSENEEVFKDIVAQLADALGVEASIDGDDDEDPFGAFGFFRRLWLECDGLGGISRCFRRGFVLRV